MEEQIAPKPTEQVQGSKIIWTTTISVVITALIIGSGIYLWQKSSLKNAEQKLQQQIVQLQNQVSELQKENNDLITTEQPSSSAQSESTTNIQFPVVVYGRPGLLNNTAEGLIEKKNLEEKLVHPYTDYYNEDGLNLVAMYITVPQNIGGQYDVVAIFGSENQYGTHDFGFGTREQEYDYWKPECMDTCDFSEAFKTKYPQIVE
jgi:type II secretory pathway pseudopilin PulG